MLVSLRSRSVEFFMLLLWENSLERFLIKKFNFIKILIVGACRGLSQLSIGLRLRSWSQGLGIEPCIRLPAQWRACFSLSLCSCSLSLSQINKYLKKKKKEKKRKKNTADMLSFIQGLFTCGVPGSVWDSGVTAEQDRKKSPPSQDVYSNLGGEGIDDPQVE